MYQKTWKTLQGNTQSSAIKELVYGIIFVGLVIVGMSLLAFI